MPKLTETALTVLEKRYFRKDEGWPDICRRVAHAVARAEGNGAELRWIEKFYDAIYNLDFLPNSPCLMNAGTELNQLSACFVLPVEDSMEGIFEAVRNGALVHKTGGGTGYSFSRLRAKGSSVGSTNGVASGPVSFARVFDAATETIKQGGKRRGANMGVLRVDHPDIMEFIEAKKHEGDFENFNFSVALTDVFMSRLLSALSPEDGETQKLFDSIVRHTWRNGEPGVLFIDTANKANPTPELGEFEATNPCGEQWLLPYESCNLGSINLEHFVKDGVVDWDRLREVTKIAVRFLDNVIDVSNYPIPEIEEAAKKTRKIGLGIMGLHGMLIQLGLPYASEEGREKAAQVMAHIHEYADKESERLEYEKGAFLSVMKGNVGARRNAALTSIQPTGSVSMIADCSSGCEPYFSIVTKKTVLDGEECLLANKHFEAVARREGFWSSSLMAEVEKHGSVVGRYQVPEKWQEVFRCAMDISPRDHILMQAALQENGVDSSISKTVNMPNNATEDDVREAIILAWQNGCKGVTIYRDGSRERQVLEVKGRDSEGLQEVTVSKNGPVKVGLPDTLDAKRYRLKDVKGNTIYLIVCFEGDKPMEVFAKFPFENQADLREKSTMWTTVCRLVSIALRYHVPMQEIIKQLDKSSGHMNDLPGQLSKLLKSFMSGTEQGYTTPCPECSGVLVFEEGCGKCYECGYSKCG